MLIQDAVFSPVISPDGRWIAAYRSKAGESTTLAPHEIAIYPRTGGAAVKVFALAPRPQEFDWTPLR